MAREWDVAHKLAVMGQLQLGAELTAAFDGKGPNPGADKLDKVEALWARERELRAAMDEFIRQRFG